MQPPMMINVVLKSVHQFKEWHLMVLLIWLGIFDLIKSKLAIRTVQHYSCAAVIGNYRHYAAVRGHLQGLFCNNHTFFSFKSDQKDSFNQIYQHQEVSLRFAACLRFVLKIGCQIYQTDHNLGHKQSWLLLTFHLLLATTLSRVVKTT